MSAGRVVLGLCALVVVGVATFVAWAWRSKMPAIEPPAASAFAPALVASGAGLAALGNCVLCHTAPGGKPFAGGLAIPTPFGAIYSTNITPDPDTGIGSWPQAAFGRAMHEGVDRTGRYLYPAFPYDHFTKVDDADLAAVYAFLMTRDPVRTGPPVNKLPFPLNIRLVVAGWQLLFFKDARFPPDAAKDEQWNRGAYLVEGLGHCGSCHTPRNLFGAEKSQEALAGGEAEGWDAPPLNSASPAPVPWTEDALFGYLRHGRDPAHGVAAGPMQPVVRDLVRIPEKDVRAIAVYLASLAGGSDEYRREKAEAAFAFAKQQEWDAAALASSGAEDGEQIFAGACADCHRLGGTAPVQLALGTAINLPDPRNLIRVILDGIMPGEGEKGPMMPGFRDVLTDPQAAALVAYVRAHFTARPAWPDVVGYVRQIRGGEQE
jgi:mono/diheme cytochrome c family protein